MSPLTVFNLRVKLKDDDGGKAMGTLTGVGFSGAIDLTTSREEDSIWMMVHSGTVASQTVGGERRTSVNGEFLTVVAGLSSVFDNDLWRVQLGGGLFRTFAAFLHPNAGSGDIADSSVTVVGILGDVRGHCTFESGWYLGLGFQLGVGSENVSVDDDEYHSAAYLWQFYVPIGKRF